MAKANRAVLPYAGLAWALMAELPNKGGTTKFSSLGEGFFCAF